MPPRNAAPQLNTRLEGGWARADVRYSMAGTQDIDEVSPGVLVWHTYDASVKADLFTTALETGTGTYVVDPIPLDSDSLLRLRTRRKVAGICVTNINHTRAAAEFAKAFSAPIYAHELRGSVDIPCITGVQNGETLAQGLTVITLEGGPVGEMALHDDDNGGTMILGDALINFEPHGFCFLPAKYCRNPRLMRRSLRKLLDYTFDRMLFAHGTPILSGARARVEQLLATR